MEDSEYFLVKMGRWADFLISEVSYDSNHKISQAKVHVDNEDSISEGEIVDRGTIAYNIKSGKSYMTIYKTLTAWKKGQPVRTFTIDGEYCLRIDSNKVTLDYLGGIPEIGAHKVEPPKEEPKPAPSPPPKPRPTATGLTHGTLPKGFVSGAKPPEPKEEEATAEQFARLEQLERKIDEQTRKLQSQKAAKPAPEIELKGLDELEQELEQFGKKVKKIQKRKTKQTSASGKAVAYCVKCKEKREIKDPIQATMKNGRAAIKGTCSVCGTKVFRLGKL